MSFLGSMGAFSKSQLTKKMLINLITKAYAMQPISHTRNLKKHR